MFCLPLRVSKIMGAINNWLLAEKKQTVHCTLDRIKLQSGLFVQSAMMVKIKLWNFLAIPYQCILSMLDIIHKIQNIGRFFHARLYLGKREN